MFGYDWQEAVAIIERQFEPGMTWDNHGTEWHIDHIKPLDSFGFKRWTANQIKKAYGVHNLMPRWATTAIAQAHGSNQTGNINKQAHWSGSHKQLELGICLDSQN